MKLLNFDVRFSDLFAVITTVKGYSFIWVPVLIPFFGHLLILNNFIQSYEIWNQSPAIFGNAF